MSTRKTSLTYKPLALLVGAMLWTLCLANGAIAQGRGVLDAGATIPVRTNEVIDADYSTGNVFTGTVTQNVMNRNGEIAVPRGAQVEMVVNNVSRNAVALDLNAIVVNGQQFRVSPGQSVVNSTRRQVMTRGQSVYVPVDSLLTFELQQPLRMGADDTRRYKPSDNYDNSPAYRAGMAAGRSDAERNLARDSRTGRWTAAQDRRDYEAGYNRGYDARITDQPQTPVTPTATIHIGANKGVSWQAPGAARVFVQVDNNPVQLFAEGASGTQVASWIEPGHVYVFMLRDANGNEIARDRLDLRRNRYPRQ